MRKDKDRDIAADPVLSNEIVLGLVQKHVPEAREVRQVDETGNRARTYMIDEDIVLKTQRPSKIRPQTSLHKEVFFLLQLQADERIRVPRVLGYGTEDGVEYTVMTRMPGVAARWLDLQGEERSRVMRDLGQMLRYIHQLDQAPFKESPFFQGSLRETDIKSSIEQQLAAAVERLGDRPPGWTLTITVEQAAGQILDSLPSHAETVALHANPGPSHTFVYPESKAFSGLIDFGDAYISHPAFDLVSWGSSEDQRHIFEGYTLEVPASGEFRAVWRAAAMLRLLRSAGRNGAAAFHEDLTHWLSQR
ncbi:Phosphotransferase enzyme family protein [Paenibacillus konkukensis]|uniref:Phosphotransferase enzyme family protein n=1 Tax=Paenibacillus konkukensis TaxID=2020716 RepID=A0ABY4REA6_9BACL|nr:aminoglycoside phosphotransferase family protein [Paenibacillus konkukensis]UQZ80928.1 Phosphotransferase enzyme family protein [Paenibacillus konkukensis]